jgi:hypothetical protein
LLHLPKGDIKKNQEKRREKTKEIGGPMPL